MVAFIQYFFPICSIPLLGLGLQTNHGDHVAHEAQWKGEPETFRRSAEERLFDLDDMPFSTEHLSRTDKQYSVHRAKPMIWYHIHKAGGTYMCSLAELAGEVLPLNHVNCNMRHNDGWVTSGAGIYWSERGMNLAKWYNKTVVPATELTPEDIQWIADHGGMERALKYSMTYTIALSCDERRKRSVQWGTTWFAIERELWETDVECKDDFMYATMLREPFSLMRSFLQFDGDFDKKQLQNLREEVENHRDLPDFKWGRGVEPNMKFLDNFQVRSLGFAMEVPAGKVNRTHYERARKMLHETFDFAIRLEDLVRHKKEFFMSLGWDADLSNIMPNTSNVTAKTHRGGYLLDFSPEEREWLQEVNKWDIELYKGLAPSRK